MSIRVAVENLSMYNNGENIYTWVDLPTDEDTWDEALVNHP